MEKEKTSKIKKIFSKNKIVKNVLTCLIIAVLFYLLTLPFRSFLKVFNTAEIRLTCVLNPVLSIFFGWPAIIGCAIGNFFVDLGSVGEVWRYFIYMIPQIIYGFVPYFLWKVFNRKETDIFKLNTMSKVLKFAGVMELSSLAFGLSLIPTLIGLPEIWNLPFFVFLNNSTICLFLGFPLFIFLSRFFKHSKLSKPEVLLLITSVVDVAAIGIVVLCFRFLGGYEDLLNYDVLNRIFIICMICIVVFLLITLLLMAFGLNKELNEKKSQLDIASSIQKSMLPKTDIFKDERFKIFASMEAAKEVGGDFYDCFYSDDNHIVFLIADVSDKGLPAALFMMRAASAIRAFAKNCCMVDQIFDNTNKNLCEYNEGNYFVTCWIGILDLTSGELKYSSAGHNSPIIKKDGKYSYLVSKRCMALGAFTSANYSYETINLKKGDKLFIYTDGLIDGRDNNDNSFGEERLLKLVSESDSSPEQVIIKIKQSVKDFSIGRNQYDDMTMLMIEFLNDIN